VDDSLFYQCFTSEIRKGRVLRWVCDADVHDSADSRFLSRSDECFTVPHSSIKCHLTMRKANPVSVVESRGSSETLGQFPDH